MSAQALAACEPAAFERRYQLNPDPWNFANSSYERQRYSSMLRALGRARYEAAYEPACSIGEFTALLAPRCESILASDASPTAVAAAQRRCAGFPHVKVEVGVLPDQMPSGRFDLIVFSEIGYYFPEAQLRLIGASLYKLLSAGGTLMVVNWLGHSANHVLHGEDVARILRTLLPAPEAGERIENSFRIDLWTRA